MNTMSTARSSYSGRLATPTSPLLYQGGVLTQGFVDSPSDIPGVAAFRSLFRSHPQHPDRVSSRSLDPTQSPTKVGSSSNKRRPSPLDIQGKREDVVQDAPLTNDSCEWKACARKGCNVADFFAAHSNLSSEMEHLRRAVQQNLKDRPLNTNVDRSNVDSEDELGSRGQPSPTDRPNSIAPAGALALIRSSKQVIVVDTRPIDQYRNEHLPRSVHIAIPTPILRRMRKAATESSSEAASWTSLAAYIHPPRGRRLWDAVDLHEHVDVILIGAEADPTINALAIILVKAIPTGAVTCLQGGWESIVAIARSEGMIITGEGSDSTDHPTPIPTVQLPNDPGPNSAPAPSQTGGVSLSCIGRNLPALSLRSTASPPRKHAPKLSLTFNNDTVPLPAKAMSSRTRPKPGGLTIDVGDSNRLAPGPLGKGSVSAVTPRRNHFTSVDLSDSTRRASLKDNVEDPDAGPSAPHSLFKPPQLDVSTILPSFLYLGPEIATRADVETLLSMGIRRVLNVAVELDDDENLGLKTNFERYYRIPMRDSVEESGVEKGIREACDILGEFCSVLPLSNFLHALLSCFHQHPTTSIISTLRRRGLASHWEFSWNPMTLRHIVTPSFVTRLATCMFHNDLPSTFSVLKVGYSMTVKLCSLYRSQYCSHNTRTL